MSLLAIRYSNSAISSEVRRSHGTHQCVSHGKEYSCKWRHTFRHERLLEKFKLLPEPFVGIRSRPSDAHMVERLIERHAFFLHEIGANTAHASRHPRPTVHQHSCVCVVCASCQVYSEYANPQLQLQNYQSGTPLPIVIWAHGDVGLKPSASARPCVCMCMCSRPPLAQPC